MTEHAGAIEAVTADVESRTATLLDVSHDIWEHPELCYEEHHAHAVLTDAIEAVGIPVERSAFGLDTAFRATVGDGTGPTVAICLEYDALPVIGHACGHNVIAAAGLGAGLAAAAVAEELGGTVVFLRPPAEEGGGGKITMIDRGALDGIDLALMIHPADAELDSFRAIAVHELHCEFHGVASHAAAAPEHGRNALDAAVAAYQNVAALRQHIGGDERIHGIFTHGGDKPNVVPHRAAQSWYVRSGSITSLEELEPRFLACLEAGALAAGCTVDHRWVAPPYDSLVDIPSLKERYRVHQEARGRTVLPVESRPQLMGSTDMGNVSHLVPSLHPMVQVSPDGVAIHTPEFAGFARGPEGDRAVVDGAVALASLVVDLFVDASLREDARAQFEAASAR